MTVPVMTGVNAAPYRAPLPLPPPPRPPLGGWIAGAVLCAALAAFTTHKLAVMSRLRGEADGAPRRFLTLQREARRFNAHQAVYHLYDPDAPERAPWEIQLTSAQVSRYRYGDTIAVRCLDDARECFVHDSVYIDDGNMAFDHRLRVMELGGLLVCASVVARRVRSWRAARRAHRWNVAAA